MLMPCRGVRIAGKDVALRSQSTCIITCTVGFARMAYGILMPFMRKAGQLLALGGLISIANGPIWGAISDRTGRKLSLMLNLDV